MKELLFTITLLFIVNIAFGQSTFYQCEIQLTSGTILEGYSPIPSSSDMREIKFKVDNSDREKEILSIEIKEILYPNKKGVFAFEYSLVDNYNPNSKTIKTEKKRRWIIREFKTQHMNLYTLADKYEVDSKGKLSVLGDMVLDYLVKKKGEKNAFKAFRYFGQMGNQKKFNETMSFYCSDVPKLANQISSGKYDRLQIFEIVKEYSKLKED